MSEKLESILWFEPKAECSELDMTSLLSRDGTSSVGADGISPGRCDSGPRGGTGVVVIVQVGEGRTPGLSPIKSLLSTWLMCNSSVENNVPFHSSLYGDCALCIFLQVFDCRSQYPNIVLRWKCPW